MKNFIKLLLIVAIYINLVIYFDIVIKGILIFFIILCLLAFYYYGRNIYFFYFIEKSLEITKGKASTLSWDTKFVNLHKHTGKILIPTLQYTYSINNHRYTNDKFSPEKIGIGKLNDSIIFLEPIISNDLIAPADPNDYELDHIHRLFDVNEIESLAGQQIDVYYYPKNPNIAYLYPWLYRKWYKIRCWILATLSLFALISMLAMTYILWDYQLP
ncbi:hypothetical protein [Ostreibacterium oceani]|uniref:DUF3592 domain-containing protein n=1 Tax=Ostreibacterium oceani TaxID=2654998 RepID=A0A6N7EY20_9GAMM|nr:hypothetical protein [Ostreibacterium oceani]MPV86475.1 hypothetical protein [Ostreibacterium oceani]